MASSKYADEGSIAHILAAMCLTENKDASAYIGRLIECEDYEHAKLSPSAAKKWMACPGSHTLESSEEFVERFFSMEVSEEMAEYVQVYVDQVRARVEEYKLAGAEGVSLLVEQKLSIGHITGEEGATGTGDAIIIASWPNGDATLDVGDLKTGMGVAVEAENNPQLQLYALGALEEYGLLWEFNRVRLTIYQPRLRSVPSEWELDPDELNEFGKIAKARAASALIAKGFAANWVDGPTYDYLNPGDHCRTGFCNARATCPKLAAYVEEGVGADFEALAPADDGVADYVTMAIIDGGVAAFRDDDLSAKMQAVDIIEDWCRAVRAEVERRLLAGTPVPGFKLVQGRKGARAWSSADEAEAIMKSMRLKQDEMYDFKLISPTTAEKLLKGTPKRWNRLSEVITQSEGKPSVAPESDKRPALEVKPVEDDFGVVDDDVDLAG